MAGKKTRGRQKIEMKYIENDDSRLITFSKRKAGILKKASEITNLCGAEVGLILTTPAGKPFSFAHPSIENITDRFLNRQSFSAMDPSFPIIQAHQAQRLKRWNDNHNELIQRVMAAKEKRKSLRQIMEAIKKGNERDNVPPGWWEVATEDVEPQEMGRVAEEMDKFIDDVTPFTTPPGPQNSLQMMTMMMDGGLDPFQMDAGQTMMHDQTLMGTQGTNMDNGLPMVGGQPTMDGQAFMDGQALMGGQKTIMGAQPNMGGQATMDGLATLGGQAIISPPPFNIQTQSMGFGQNNF